MTEMSGRAGLQLVAAILTVCDENAELEQQVRDMRIVMRDVQPDVIVDALAGAIGLLRSLLIAVAEDEGIPAGLALDAYVKKLGLRAAVARD